MPAAIRQIDSENADRDLTSLVTCLTHTVAEGPTWCVGIIKLGDGAKNLDGTGGDFEVTVVVGGQTIQPASQVITFSTAVLSAVYTAPFPVGDDEVVTLAVKSPNVADTDVDVTAVLYDVSPLQPTTQGLTLDVSATGEAGIDWANIGGPTTAVALSGTTIKTATDVETDTANIQSRIPAALTAGGMMKADLEEIIAVALTETLPGYLAAAFKKLFNVAAPVLTSASVNQTGDSYAVVNHADHGNAQLVRATTPANRLATDAVGNAAADVKLVKTVDADTAIAAGATAALNSYDPPTNTEMAARTRLAAEYALEATVASVFDSVCLVNTTIATLASQTLFTLTAGSADDNAYNGLVVVVEDAATATQKCWGTIKDYTGATKTVELDADPGIFTMGITDKVRVLSRAVNRIFFSE